MRQLLNTVGENCIVNSPYLHALSAHSDFFVPKSVTRLDMPSSVWQDSTFFLRTVIVVTLFLTSLFPPSLLAQIVTNITPDATLPSNSVVNPNGNVFDITAGTSVGNNLFHSFLEFNVGSGDVANFVDPGGVANILSRVTGINVSNIFGQLRSNSSANLFFLNPNGVVFGPESSLDIGGSFHVSTANFVNLGDGAGLFSASDPQSDVLLAAPPSAFGFLPGNISTGSVEIQGLRHDLPGQTVEIVGGDILIRNGALTVPGGNIDLAGTNVTITDGGKIMSDATSTLNGGDISINVSGQVLLENNSEISSTSNTRDAGNITFKVGELLTLPGTVIRSLNLSEEPGAGNAGDVTIEGPTSPVPGQILLVGTDITTEAGAGESGDIFVDGAGRIILDDTTISSVVTAGEKSSGDITIIGGKTNSGNFAFGDEQLLLRNVSRVIAENFGTGNAGTITLEMAGTLRLTNSEISAGARQGQGGNILLSSDGLIILQDSSLFTIVEGKVNDLSGGNISLASEAIIVQNSLVGGFAFVGTGGAINFIANAVLIDGFSLIGGVNFFGNVASLVIFPPQPTIADVAKLYGESCVAQRSGAFSSLNVRGRDRIPFEPGDYLGTPLWTSGTSSSISGGTGASSTSIISYRLWLQEADYQRESVDTLASIDYHTNSLALFNSRCRS